MHDGKKKNGNLFFEDDGKIYTKFGNGHGKWEIMNTDTIRATFGNKEHVL